MRKRQAPLWGGERGKEGGVDGEERLKPGRDDNIRKL
jgi:hypothetical protein